MQSIQEVITGKEDGKNLTTPYQSLVQFYHAFNERDIEAMRNNWWQSDETSMDNPLGGIKRGWNEIQEVYERIFNGKAKVYVEYFDYTIHETEEMFYTVGRERGYVHIEDKDTPIAIRTSRIFKKINDQWKQVHHHGSIDNPELLAAYQNVIINQQQKAA